MESFQNGLPYIAVSEAGGKFTLSPSDLPKAFGPASGSTKYALFAYVDPDTKQIGYKDLGYTENIRAIGGNYPGRYPFATIPAELKQNDFVAELNAWDQKSELSRTMTQAITPSSKRQAEFSSSWFGKRYRLGDHLRWFHRATGVNVIAPANRTAHPWMKLSRPDATQGEYVADLMKSSGGYAQMSDGYLLVRDGNYWRKAANEVPEEVFAPLEFSANSDTTMSGYAGFMSKLNSIQSTLVQDREGFVVRFDRYPVSLAGPALRFVNSLSEGNVYQAGTSTGLPYDSLNPSQRKLFARAVVQGISDQGFITPGLVDYLGVNGYQYQSLDKMSFHLRSMKMKVTRDPVVVNDNGESIESLPLSVKTCATMHFEFGYNDQSLIKYYADVN